MQAASGFAGTLLHGARSESGESGGSWAEGACGAPRGGAPKPFSYSCASARLRACAFARGIVTRRAKTSTGLVSVTRVEPGPPWDGRAQTVRSGENL